MYSSDSFDTFLTGTEMKSAACTVTGCMVALEIQQGKVSLCKNTWNVVARWLVACDCVMHLRCLHTKEELKEVIGLEAARQLHRCQKKVILLFFRSRTTRPCSQKNSLKISSRVCLVECMST